MYILSTT